MSDMDKKTRDELYNQLLLEDRVVSLHSRAVDAILSAQFQTLTASMKSNDIIQKLVNLLLQQGTITDRSFYADFIRLNKMNSEAINTLNVALENFMNEAIKDGR